MRAVVFEGPNSVSVHQLADPTLTSPDAAIVQVDLTSICGSDLHIYWGEFGPNEGTRPGHEFIGTVMETGKEVSHIRPGDRVLAMPLYGCGQCASCQDLRPTGCHGGPVTFGMPHQIPGGQAEFVTVPHADYVLRKIPPWMTADQAVLMTDVLPTGCFGAWRANIAPGSTVVVVGLGPVGLSAVANAFTYQPAQVLAFDTVPERRVRAAALGAIALDPAAAPLDAQVREATGGLGAHSVIEAVGKEATLVQAFQATRAGGTLSVVGIVAAAAVPISPVALATRNVDLRFGTCDMPLMWQKLFPLLEQGKLDIGDVFTHRMPLTEASAGYRLFANRLDGVMKVVFDARS